MAELQIPITKAKGSFVTIDSDALPQDVYTEALIQGLKVLVNRGTSKVTKAHYPNADELKAKAIEVANAQVELINTSKIKFTGQKKASGHTGAEKTEAMRLARQLVKDEMKKAGIKISHVAASEITKVAKEVLEGQPELYEMAKANIAARQTVTVAGLNIKDAIKTDPALVEKAEAKATAAKAGQLSKTQAGKVKTRAKGQQANA